MRQPFTSSTAWHMKKLVRSGGIEPPAFSLGRRHKFINVNLSFGLEFFLTRDSAGPQFRTKHMPLSKRLNFSWTPPERLQ